MSGIGNKRTAGEPGPSAPPEKKAGVEDSGTTVETIKLGGVSSTEELDIRTLQTKNRKLAEMLDQRQAIEDELREHIEKLERRQATDDASLLIINRYWNQVGNSFCYFIYSFLVSLYGCTPFVTSILYLVLSSVVELNTYLSHENGRLQELADVLQEKHRVMSQEFSKLQERVETAESRVSVLETMTYDLQWDIDKIRKREQRLNRHLADVLERVSAGYKVYGAGSSLYGGIITTNARKFEEMNAELEENNELAGNRLHELEELRQDLEEVTTQNEKLKVELRRAVEEAVKETPEYRCMQSQFSVLYNESLQLKAHLDEARTLLHGTRATHQRQVELIERDEVSLHKKLRTEVIQLEDTLAQVRKEYEMLRIEFEQTLAANEQAGPINREMRHLISSLQNHNHQLKGEVLRYKRKLREAQSDLSKVTQQRMPEKRGKCLEEGGMLSPLPGLPTFLIRCAGRSEIFCGALHSAREREKEKEKEKEREREKEKEKEKEREREKQKLKESEKERESKEKEKGKHEDGRKKEAEVIKQLKAELKKAQESQKEMKLLLDMYRSAPKEQRDKVQLMAAEKKAKAELEELRQRVKELEDKEKKESKKMADEDALRKIRAVEEQIEYLQKKLAMAKQEEEALLSEMDVTGQAFEDMQEQNILMQQLREKDDANFKLMSERIKSNQIHKLLKEEKEELADQVLTLKTQVDAQLQVVRKLEEKEHLLQSSIGTGEKELGLRTQALEMNKRKAMDAAQLADDLKAQLELAQKKLHDFQEEIVENRVTREKEMFNFKRAEEDISRLRRKLETTKKPDMVPNCDEILMEEIKDYNACLTCPCCNMHKKDMVLTKCVHVFCFECMKTHYDTRQHKCPKCIAAFGANDFHRIYIG
uniref:E3 ubiquitin protein ligase n=1 Tax=Serinus canaria TaxID=9135 RepID=A0A8C9MP10_SERCA